MAVAVLRTAAAQPEAAAVMLESYSRRLLEPLAHADPLVDAATEELIGIYAATVQRYLTEPLPTRS